MTLDEAKDYRDRAEALRAYAKQASNREAEVQFAEIKVRAEIKCGELLQEMALNGGDRKSESHNARVKLSDVGISADQSSRYQESARAPRERTDEDAQ